MPEEDACHCCCYCCGVGRVNRTCGFIHFFACVSSCILSGVFACVSNSLFYNWFKSGSANFGVLFFYWFCLWFCQWKFRQTSCKLHPCGVILCTSTTDAVLESEMIRKLRMCTSAAFWRLTVTCRWSRQNLHQIGSVTQPQSGWGQNGKSNGMSCKTQSHPTRWLICSWRAAFFAWIFGHGKRNESLRAHVSAAFSSEYQCEIPHDCGIFFYVTFFAFGKQSVFFVAFGKKSCQTMSASIKQ